MKKLISKLLALALAGSIMVGCASGTTSTTTTATTTDSESLSVVTTIFPIYDWTKVILGEDLENVTLTYLENTGVDVHSFEPTVSDMAAMATCDMFIYVGGESDDWVAAVLANVENPDMVVINLLDVLGEDVMVEAEVEGMQEHDHDHDDEESEEDHDHDHDDEEATEEEHDHDHDDEEATEEEHDHDHDDEEATEEEHDHDHDDEEATEEEHDHDHDDEEATEEEHDHDHDDEVAEETTEEDHDHDHDEELDEHVWLSLNNAAVICQVIANELAVLNPAQADLYAVNVADYLVALADLDAEYQAVVADAAQTTLLFTDRFPYQYMMEDYGLSYYAAFSGCSTETEATFETISFLATKIDELGLTVVLTTEDPVAGLADTVISSTTNKDQTVLQLDSMQAVTQSEVDAGASYLSIMESNLEVLAQAVQ